MGFWKMTIDWDRSDYGLPEIICASASLGLSVFHLEHHILRNILVRAVEVYFLLLWNLLIVDKKTNKQNTTWELKLSSNLGQNEDYCQETTPHIVLRTAPEREGVERKVSVHVILVKERTCIQSQFFFFLFCRFLLVTRNRIIIRILVLS